MDPSRDVGARVEVYWANEADWFQGTIQEYDAQVGYRILYDDGDEQWEDAINTERLHVLRETSAQHDVEAMEPPGDDTEDDTVVGAMEPPDELGDEDVDLRASTADVTSMFKVEITPEALLGTTPAQEATGASLVQRESEAFTPLISDQRPSIVASLPLPQPTSTLPAGISARSNLTDDDDSSSVDWTLAPVATRPASSRRPSIPKAYESHIGAIHVPSTSHIQPPDKPLARRRRAGPGIAILQGRVEYLRSELDTIYNAFVKVSFVAPGPGNVMLRCKTVLYTTSVVPASARPTWSDATWRYEIPNEFDMKPWASLRGDILIAVFDHSSHNNLFIGQLLVPIASLLDDDCPEGLQTRFDEEYALTSRQGKVLGGIYLRLSHQLQLPPSDASTALATTTNSPMAPKNPLKKKPLTATAKRKHVASPAINRSKRAIEIERENAAIKKRVAAAKGRAVKLPTVPQGVATHRAHSSVNRQRELAAIEAENRRLAARRVPKPKPSTVMDQSESDSNSKTPKPQRVDLESQATYVVQVELTTAVAALQHEIASLQQEAFAAKASLSRYTISNAKDLRAVETLQRACDRALAASSKRDAAHKPSSAKGLSTATTHEAGAAPEKVRHLALLEQEHAAVTKERQDLLAYVRTLHADEGDVQEAVSKLENDLGRADRRRLYLSNPAELDDDEQAMLHSAWNEMTSLKVHVAALEEQVDRSDGSVNANGAGEDGAAKLEARKAKELQLQTQRDAYRSQYEALVGAKTVETLRQAVLEMQHMLLLCEREEKAMAAATAEADAVVQDAAMAFERQFRAEQTDTDILFKVTAL